MERSSKKGKIPQQDWASIIKRYEAGETLASIARTYDCSPPAISYIISRSRTRDAAEGPEPTEVDTRERLVKGQANDMPPGEEPDQKSESNEVAAPVSDAQPSYPIENSDPQLSFIEDSAKKAATALDGGTDAAFESTAGAADPHATPAPLAVHVERRDTEISLETKGVQSNSDEHRGTLHLSISSKSPQRVEISPDGNTRPEFANNSTTRPVENPQPAPTRPFVHQNSASKGTLDNGDNGLVTAVPNQARGGVAFIDRALRQRVDDDISAFLAAFDAALAEDTIESRAGLREATDRLLRAGARTRIELERLEARLPLSAREAGGYSAQNSRLR
ncbi:MAG: hypothetical protein JOY83_13860 [Alphaproteobacteria bacterium]|nr:hypothetical protein [Alphaproteobacteria bacterium]